jgi:1-phosphofructokinase family hexose kinase
MGDLLVNSPKIICVSANPALDRRLRVDSLEAGEVNRAHGAEASAGGKAAHVAMCGRALGADVTWIGFLGGPIGQVCGEELRKLVIAVVPVETKATTRVNVEVIEDSGRITEVLEPSGQPSPDEQAEMLRVFREGLCGKWKGGIVVISGSLPAGVPQTFYVPFIQAARAAGSRVLLDTSGDALLPGIHAGPNFVKPNRREAESFLSRSIRDIQDATAAVRELTGRGAGSAAITLGAAGLVWLESRTSPVRIARPPQLKAISTVGCGDATLAGFAYAMLQRLSSDDTVRLASACGAANCLAEFAGRISAEDVQTLIPQIEVELV